jgi:cell division protein FtsL
MTAGLQSSTAAKPAPASNPGAHPRELVMTEVKKVKPDKYAVTYGEKVLYRVLAVLWLSMYILLVCLP